MRKYYRNQKFFIENLLSENQNRNYLINNFDLFVTFIFGIGNNFRSVAESGNVHINGSEVN